MFNVSWKDIQPYMDNIQKAIAEIAHGLGVAAEHVYIVLVRQQFMTGVTELATCLFTLLLYIFLLWLFRKCWKSENGQLQVFYGFVAVIGAVVLMIVFANNAIDGLQHVLNPEYYAMQDILNQLKNLHN